MYERWAFSSSKWVSSVATPTLDFPGEVVSKSRRRLGAVISRVLFQLNKDEKLLVLGFEEALVMFKYVACNNIRVWFIRLIALHYF